jgi:hypothetical protein
MSQEACAGFAACRSIQRKFGVTHEELWEPGFAGSDTVADSFQLSRVGFGATGRLARHPPWLRGDWRMLACGTISTLEA